MSMDKKTVEKIARLAAIELQENEKEIYVEQLGKILELAEKLQEVDTDGVEPLSNVTDITLKMREDVINDGGIVDKILQNAPEDTENYFVVQKVIE